jgi:TetR/AcrR family transcriptional repressor of nem operon
MLAFWKRPVYYNGMNRSDTRERLIEVGVKIILGKGYHAAGLQEILLEANVPKGSFYHYFKSKEDFCIAIIDHYIEEYNEKSLSNLSAPSMTAKQRLLLFFTGERDYYLGQQCLQGCLVVKLITEMSQVSAPIRLRLKSGIDIWVRALAACIRDGVEAGEFQPLQSPEFMADYIHSAWIGALVRMQVTESIEPLNIFISFLEQQLGGR